MRIALVTPYEYPYPGGVTEHVRHLDRELTNLGHETQIIAASTADPAALPSNMITLSDEITPVKLNGSSARLALSPDVFGRMQAVLNEGRFDIVHLHEPFAPVMSLAALGASQAITVGTFHAYFNHPIWNGPLEQVVKAASLGLDGCILVSRALHMRIRGYLTCPYRVIPNGIDYQRFASPAVRPIPDFDDGRPNLLFVGRMEPRKGFAVLLKAFPIIQRSIPDVRLIVAGAYSDEDKQRLEDEMREKNLRNVFLVGRVSDEDLARYYRTATVYVAPSLGGESFGIVLLEAMSAGTTVVASGIAGYRSVLSNGKDGVLVPPGDAQALAKEVIELLQSPERRAQLEDNGRITAAQYDWGLVTPQVVDFYNFLLNDRDRPRIFRIPARLRKYEDRPLVEVKWKSLGDLKIKVHFHY